MTNSPGLGLVTRDAADVPVVRLGLCGQVNDEQQHSGDQQRRRRHPNGDLSGPVSNELRILHLKPLIVSDLRP